MLRRGEYFAILMGPEWWKCLPYFSIADKKSFYIFDAWPHTHEAILAFVERFHVERVFVSSSEATSMLGAVGPPTTFVWCPEAIDPTVYTAKSIGEKDIDVLHLGRRYDWYHHQIRDALQTAGRRYYFERDRGVIIFPSRAQFIDGLARSKVSICVPASISHPGRAEGLETMTLRYLQSMVAKCLIVGHAPAEIVTLFRYNPVVEIARSDPGRQLVAILDNYEQYLPLIQRNYETVRAEHTWSQRWASIRAELRRP